MSKEFDAIAKEVLERHDGLLKRLDDTVGSTTIKVAIKNDSEKPQLDLIPYSALTECAKAFGYGAKKYARWNYKKGMAHSRLLNAALRHLMAYKEGEDLDPESGNSHLGHCLASVCMLVDCIKNHPELDDRYKGETNASKD